MTFEEVGKIVRNPRNIGYVGMIIPPRPGVRLCITRLEYERYAPGTARNELFQLAILKWEDIYWMLVCIPKEGAPFMEKMAAECGLHIADGVPTIVSAEGIEHFPINEPNLFTFENVPGHKFYDKSPEDFKGIIEEESRQIDLFLGAWKARN